MLSPNRIFLIYGVLPLAAHARLLDSTRLRHLALTGCANPGPFDALRSMLRRQHYLAIPLAGIRSGQCSVAVQSYFVAKAFGTTRVTMYPCSAFVASAVQLLQSASSSTAGVKYGG
jgi:hypothetical protein